MKRSFLILFGVSIVIIAIIASNYNKPSVKINNFIMKEKLDKSLIDKYMSSSGHEKEELEDKIKQKTIKDMELDKWLEYIEYVKLIVYPVDIVDDSKKDLIIGLNLSKNLGAIGIYKLDGENYILEDKIENLTTIEKISVKIDETKSRKFLLVEEFLDERVGAYFTDKFLRVFTNIDDKFEEVFRQSIDYEAYVYEKWIDADKENPKWYKFNENNIIDYDFEIDNNASFSVYQKIKKLEGQDGSSSEIPTKFKQVEESEFKTKYYWSEEYKRFIMGKGEIISTGEKVAILEDTSRTVDYLLNLGDKYYKVINKNMTIKHIKHDKINIIDI